MSKNQQIAAVEGQLPPMDEFFYESMIKGISSWDDLRHLGRNNLQQLIAHLRSSEKSLAKQIRRVRAEQDILQGKSGSHIRELSDQFERPSNIRMKVYKDSCCKVPEPSDDDSINRKPDATTFNLCGWCRHGSAVTGRCGYGYGINPTCGLLRFNKEMDCEGLADTPCKLHEMTAEQFNVVVDSMEKEVDRL